VVSRGSFPGRGEHASRPRRSRAFYSDLRSGYSLPALREIADIDREFKSKGMIVNLRGIMAQLAWHWIYHSGQIGLIRLLWGSDYSWSFEKELVLHPV
jgi:hypothetical protein